jgi:glycosyltransferase involved in cell wall biosynthesis
VEGDVTKRRAPAARTDRARADRPRVLVIGDAIASTGFARVLHSIIERLKDRWEFHHVGINYYGDPHDLDWRIYPACAEGDVLGTNRIHGLIRLVRPELVFALNDIWVLAGYMERLRELPERPKTLMYCPIDAGPIRSGTVERLRGLDRLVTYTRFGKRVVDDAVAELRGREPGFPFAEVAIIPHGVDTHRFYPLNGGPEDVRARRRAVREELLPRRPDLWDGFLVFNGNRNQPRKRIDITLQAFARFAEGLPPNVALYLHMGVEDLGWHLPELARRYRIEDRLVLTDGSHSTPGVPDSMLNRIYNACDVGVNTSVGEGWGLVSFEHAATGAAQLVPRHSACEELWGGSGVLVEPAVTVVTERILTEGKLVAPEAVAEELTRLYRDPELLASVSEASYRTATRPEYGWDRVAEQWDELFREVLSSGREV